MKILKFIGLLSGLVFGMSLLAASVGAAQQGSSESTKAALYREIERASQQIIRSEAEIGRAEDLLRRIQSGAQSPDNVKAQQLTEQAILNHQQAIASARRAIQQAQEKLSALERPKDSDESRHAALDRDIDEMIRLHESEIAHHKKMVGVWQKALRDLQKGANPQKELEYWARESQEAQQEAILAATSYLMGPLSEAMRQAQLAGTLALSNYHNIKPALKRTRENLQKYRRVWSKYQRLREELIGLETDLQKAESVLQATVNFRELAEPVQKFGDRTLTIVKVSKLVVEPAEKQKLMASMAELQGLSFELLKSAGLDRLIEEAGSRGMDIIAGRVRIAKFVAEYGVAMVKFGTAWGQINTLLEKINDRNSLSLEFSMRIQQDEDQRRLLTAEVTELRSARQAPLPSKEEVIRLVRARDLELAHKAGDWFSNATGFRAPGELILKEQRP